MQNCEKLCRTVRIFAKLCRLCGWWHGVGWQLVCGVGSGQWAHISSSISSLQEEKLSPSPAQPSPASGVWRNGVSQARQAGAAPNLGWTGHPHGGPRTPQGYGDSVTSSDPSAAADTSQHQQPDFPDTEKLRHLAPASSAQVTEFAQQTCKQSLMMFKWRVQ